MIEADAIDLARAHLAREIPKLEDEDVVALSRLVALLPLARLREELASIRDTETKGTTHALVPMNATGDRLFTKGSVRDALDRLLRGT